MARQAMIKDKYLHTWNDSTTAMSCLLTGFKSDGCMHQAKDDNYWNGRVSK